MAYLPKTKVIKGKTFRLHNDYLRHDTAQWEGEKLRSKGWTVYIVKILGLYGVYKRRT